jgi:hypothetical protein
MVLDIIWMLIFVHDIRATCLICRWLVLWWTRHSHIWCRSSRIVVVNSFHILGVERIGLVGGRRNILGVGRIGLVGGRRIILGVGRIGLVGGRRNILGVGRIGLVGGRRMGLVVDRRNILDVGSGGRMGRMGLVVGRRNFLGVGRMGMVGDRMGLVGGRRRRSEIETFGDFRCVEVDCTCRQWIRT